MLPTLLPTLKIGKSMCVSRNAIVLLYHWRLYADDVTFMSGEEDCSIMLPEPVHMWDLAVGQLQLLSTSAETWHLRAGLFSIQDLLRGLNGYDSVGQLATGIAKTIVSIWPSGSIEWLDNTVPKRDMKKLHAAYLGLVKRNDREVINGES